MDDIGGGEWAAIERIRALLPSPPPNETWIGDDAAAVAHPGGPLLLAADLVVEGVHADLSLVGLDDLGWKALAVNVSDIAAMGGRPLHALVCVAGPAHTDLDRLYTGIAAACAEYRCAVVVGDLSNAEHVTVAVAITGECPGGRVVLRSGARPGDALVVTGGLGRSAAGLAALRRTAARAEDAGVGAAAAPGGDAGVGGAAAPGGNAGGDAGGGGDAVSAEAAAHVEAYRRPRARVSEGMVAAAIGATAMIDVSDGLAMDVRHLADASGVGVDLSTVPVHPSGSVSEEEALLGGEDYELLFAAPDADAVCDAFTTAGLRTPIVIGRCTADPAERRLRGGPLPVGGWEHRWGGTAGHGAGDGPPPRR